MSARDLAIGILLGGGGQTESLLPYIVANSVYLDTLPINSVYHCDLRLMYVDNSGFDWTQSDSKRPFTDGIYLHSIGCGVPTGYNFEYLNAYEFKYIYLFAFAIVYKNNAPIYAVYNYIYTQSQTFLGEKIEGGVTKPITTMRNVFQYDMSTIVKQYETASFYSSSYQAQNGNIFYTGGNNNGAVAITRYEHKYNLRYDPQTGHYPEYYETDTYTQNAYLPYGITTSSAMNTFITDLSSSDLLSEIANVVMAINGSLYGVTQERMEFIPPPQPT